MEGSAPLLTLASRELRSRRRGAWSLGPSAFASDADAQGSDFLPITEKDLDQVDPDVVYGPRDDSTTNEKENRNMKTSRTINDIVAASTSAGQEELTFEELATVYGGSGMMGAPAPTPRKDNNNRSNSGGTLFPGDPYTPPVSIPNPVPEPWSSYFPSDFPLDGIGIGY